MAKSPSDDLWFSRRPPQELITQAYQLLRVKTGAGVTGIILSHDLLGCYTHWWLGRTTPHRPSDCAPCAGGSEMRWKGWVAVYGDLSRTIQILEVTPKCCPAIDTWFRGHRTLRGARIRVQRVSKRVNAPLSCSICDGTMPADDLPKAPDLARILLRMWAIDGTDFHVRPSGQLPLPEQLDHDATE